MKPIVRKKNGSWWVFKSPKEIGVIGWRCVEWNSAMVAALRISQLRLIDRVFVR